MNPAPAPVSAAPAAPAAAVRRPAAGRLDWLKPAVTAGGLVPLVVMLWRVNTGYYTDPTAATLHQTGMLGLVLLVASLACTPLKLMTPWAWPMRLRKTLGLFGFFYVALHFAIYLGWDLGFDFAHLGEDIAKRPFITFGFLSFVLLLPLAFTSSASSVRRLGAKNWTRLHMLAYPAALLGAVHFLWRGKTWQTEPLTYFAILLALLAVRVLAWLSKRPAKPPAAARKQ